jgi:hypothetical protein
MLSNPWFPMKFDSGSGIGQRSGMSRPLRVQIGRNPRECSIEGNAHLAMPFFLQRKKEGFVMIRSLTRSFQAVGPGDHKT